MGCTATAVPRGGHDSRGLPSPLRLPQPDGTRFSREDSPTPTIRAGGVLSHDQRRSTKLLFFYYNKNDNIRVTDLSQGNRLGHNPISTDRDPRLVNRLSITDGDYGTVLNRFLHARPPDRLSAHRPRHRLVDRAFIHIRAFSQVCGAGQSPTRPNLAKRSGSTTRWTGNPQGKDLARRVAAAPAPKVEPIWPTHGKEASRTI